MGKLFGKVMASLLSGAMLFGGTSFADGGLSKFCLVEDEDMRDGENTKGCSICFSSVECERNGGTVKITKRVMMEDGPERIIRITKHMGGGKKVDKVIKGKDEEVCNVKMGCCGYYFCRKCMFKWMSAAEGNSYKCPLCRAKLDVDSAKSLLTSYERLQFEMRSKYNKLIGYCKEHPDVALSAAYYGVYLTLVLGMTIYSASSRNWEKSEVDCDPDCDGCGCCCDGCDGECGCVIS